MKLPGLKCAVGEADKRSIVADLLDDRTWLTEAVRSISPYVGRLFLGSAKIAGQTMSPGTVLPGLVHGGPGRAGGGEELGGVRGMGLYLQRTAVQGDKAILEALLKP
jgi:oxepin-CoA hydrolase/3-oxo-5,6-dehydrosuberyl-CoA semialdehyde dehydrogenase